MIANLSAIDLGLMALLVDGGLLFYIFLMTLRSVASDELSEDPSRPDRRELEEAARVYAQGLPQLRKILLVALIITAAYWLMLGVNLWAGR